METPAAIPTPPEAADATANSRWGVLRHKHFRRVFAAAFVSNVGTWMELLAIQMIVAHVTGSLKMLGILGAVHLLPVLMFGLLGGLLADRVNRKMLLIVTQFMLMLIAGAMAVVSATEMPPDQRVNMLLGLAALNGLVMAFNVPAWQVLTPRLVPRAELTRAITANGVQFNLARVIGPAIAGMLLGWYGPTPLFILNAVTFIGVLAAIWTTPDSPAPPRSGVPWTKEIAAAGAFVFRQPGPLAILFAMVLMSALAAPLIRMLPLVVIDVYGIGAQLADSAVGAVVTSSASTNSAADRATGVLIAILGVGAVIGGISLRHVPPWYPKHHFIPMAITGAGLSITGFAFCTSMVAGCIVILICGIFWIWGFNQSWAAMQHAVPDEMRGRVLAIANVASFGANAAGNLASGWLGEGMAPYLGRAMATQLAVGGMSFVLLVAGVVMLVHRVPEVDGMPRRPMPRTLRKGLVNAVLATEHRPRERALRDDAE